jgi:hypothetical protein
MIDVRTHTPFVPAKAGTQSGNRTSFRSQPWVPAFAGTNGVTCFND